MNYLAHLHLGLHTPDALVGSLAGDFVKGPLKGERPLAIENAVRLHRAIDAYVDQHATLGQTAELFPRALRRTRGIALDMFFDHCLAKHWEHYADQPMRAFTQQVYRALEQSPYLPAGLARIAPRMSEQDWLSSYQEWDVVERALNGIARRLSRPELLDGSFQVLTQHYAQLEDLFHQLYPDLQVFARNHLALR